MKMAAYIRHGVRKAENFNLTYSFKFLVPRKCYSKRSEQLPHGRSLKATRESIAAKGFLRSQRAYFPPADVADKVNSICESVFGSTNTVSDLHINSPDSKFKLLDACFREFKHGVPNSLLHTMTSLGDVIEYYQTPVNANTPLDALKNIELPPNLHIQHEYHRFHPDTDTMFGGISAFTKSSTIVTGLKYKKKYKGHVAKTSWP